jgi:hypothetical protein
MVYGDRPYNEDPVANLNSNSPLNFTDSLSAEDLARDLDLFTNTQFFDFDLGNISSTNNPNSRFTPSKPEESSVPHISISNEPDISNHFNFLSGGSPFKEVTNEEPLSFDLSVSGPSEDDGSPAKRPKIDSKSEESTSVVSLDEAAKIAAEEDKRRRNTLASARFRAKKKLREQALEKDHKEMSAKIEKMENRIKELELENKWLRGLVVQSKSSS